MRARSLPRLGRVVRAICPRSRADCRATRNLRREHKQSLSIRNRLETVQAVTAFALRPAAIRDYPQSGLRIRFSMFSFDRKVFFELRNPRKDCKRRGWFNSFQGVTDSPRPPPEVASPSGLSSSVASLSPPARRSSPPSPTGFIFLASASLTCSPRAGNSRSHRRQPSAVCSTRISLHSRMAERACAWAQAPASAPPMHGAQTEEPPCEPTRHKRST